MSEILQLVDDELPRLENYIRSRKLSETARYELAKALLEKLDPHTDVAKARRVTALKRYLEGKGELVEDDLWIRPCAAVVLTGQTLGALYAQNCRGTRQYRKEVDGAVYYSLFDFATTLRDLTAEARLAVEESAPTDGGTT